MVGLEVLERLLLLRLGVAEAAAAAMLIPSSVGCSNFKITRAAAALRQLFIRIQAEGIGNAAVSGTVVSRSPAVMTVTFSLSSAINATTGFPQDQLLVGNERKSRPASSHGRDSGGLNEDTGRRQTGGTGSGGIRCNRAGRRRPGE